jgi:AcrR family transcriptional regulator
VFDRDGFRAATVRAVAAEAGVTSAALYHHFDGREGLVLAACEPKMSALKMQLETVVPAESGPMNHALAIL